MKFDQSVSLKDLNQLIQGKIIGDENAMVSGLNEIHKVTEGDMTFVDFHKYYDVALESAATFVIINKEVDAPEGKSLIFSEDPFRDYNILVSHFRSFKPQAQAIAESATIGKGTTIQPNCFIGERVVIGENCIIHANVVIYDHAVIGNNVIIHSNTTLGADAFYFKTRKERELYFDKLNTCGRVVVHDDVEIGANCTIDKGVSGDTIIGAGSKLDNQVHVAHGVVIGKNALIAAQVGIAGKTTLGDGVTLWGQVGVNKDLTIGDGAVVLAQSGVPKDLEGGKVYFGSPSGDAREKMRELSLLKRLPEMWEKLKSK